MNLFSSLFRRSEKRRAYSNLMQLDARLLRDIGLSRSDLHEMMQASRTSRTRRSHDHE